MRMFRPMVLSVFAGALLALAPGFGSPEGELLAQSVPASASELAGSAQLEAAVTAHERAPDRVRTQIRELLNHDQVRGLAEARGIDLVRAEERAATLSDEEVAKLETLVSESSAMLAQSQTISISVYTIIIILLILILIT